MSWKGIPQANITHVLERSSLGSGSVLVHVSYAILQGEGPIEGAKMKLKSDLRSRSKKRVFDKMWDQYSEAFQSYYNNLPRHLRTKVVNTGVEMVDGKYVSNVQEKYEMSERIKKAKTKESAIGSGGVIRECAEVGLG